MAAGARVADRGVGSAVANVGRTPPQLTAATARGRLGASSAGTRAGQRFALACVSRLVCVSQVCERSASRQLLRGTSCHSALASLRHTHRFVARSEQRQRCSSRACSSRVKTTRILARTRLIETRAKPLNAQQLMAAEAPARRRLLRARARTVASPGSWCGARLRASRAEQLRVARRPVSLRAHRQRKTRVPQQAAALPG